MATKDGLRYYPEKASGTYKYRIVMDYYHPFEDKWKQVTCGSNSVTKGALDAAKPKLEQKVRRILDGFNKKKKNLTVSEALDEWYKFRDGSVAVGTHTDDIDNTRVFKSTFGKWQLVKLEKDHIKDYLMKLKVAPSSRKNYRSKLNLFFQFCEDEGYIKESPMYRVRLPRHKETLEEKQKREDKYFTVEEMRILLDAMEERADRSTTETAKNNKWRRRMFIEFQFSIGDRISESLGLRYQDIDFQQGVIYLKTQLDVNSSVTNPKVKPLKTTQSERSIVLKKREIEILSWFWERNHDGNDFVFVQENDHLLSQTLINDYLKTFHDVLPYKLITSFVSHAMRHSNVLVQKELGVDEQIIVARGGWADTQMISRVYGRHVTPILLEKADHVLKDFSVRNSQKIHEKIRNIEELSGEAARA
ncbi:tyrosine-type recombinase/integrase [Lactococcus nasutitermitis]|uniref:Tyrosine-type recombinase/integrase n=1 Tax=Lactococcus nasutitermitis TaxID=1652957 RepID=A0ABV9JDD8_9LACT|nr:tyrosine-type recombinase/integrase [Lactococcus nasutitermitis]